MDLGLYHVILMWFVPSVYPKSAIYTPLHRYYGIRIHSYVHPQHGKVRKHFIYTLDESVIQSGVSLGFNHATVVWIVPSVYPKSAISTPLHCYYGVRIHSYVHPQHGKVLQAQKTTTLLPISSSLGTGSIARGSSLSSGSYIFHIFLCFEFFYDILISYVENEIFMDIADSYNVELAAIYFSYFGPVIIYMMYQYPM